MAIPVGDAPVWRSCFLDLAFPLLIGRTQLGGNSDSRIDSQARAPVSPALPSVSRAPHPAAEPAPPRPGFTLAVPATAPAAVGATGHGRRVETRRRRSRER